MRSGKTRLKIKTFEFSLGWARFNSAVEQKTTNAKGQTRSGPNSYKLQSSKAREKWKTREITLCQKYLGANGK